MPTNTLPINLLSLEVKLTNHHTSTDSYQHYILVWQTFSFFLILGADFTTFYAFHLKSIEFIPAPVL